MYSHSYKLNYRCIFNELMCNGVCSSLLFSVGSCSPNDTPCVSSCEGHPNGDYQSCHGCHVYVTCVHDVIVDDRQCPGYLVWDDIVKRCEWESNTCSMQCPGWFFFFFRVLHTIFSHLQAHAFARSVTVARLVNIASWL